MLLVKNILKIIENLCLLVYYKARLSYYWLFQAPMVDKAPSNNSTNNKRSPYKYVPYDGPVCETP
jgi:hypothetical protein